MGRYLDSLFSLALRLHEGLGGLLFLLLSLSFDEEEAMLGCFEFVGKGGVFTHPPTHFFLQVGGGEGELVDAGAQAEGEEVGFGLFLGGWVGGWVGWRRRRRLG